MFRKRQIDKNKNNRSILAAVGKSIKTFVNCDI